MCANNVELYEMETRITHEGGTGSSFQRTEIEPMETDTTFEQFIRRTENTISQLATDATTSTG